MTVDKSEITNFFRHLVLARGKLKEREDAHKEMYKQIKKVQQLASEKKIKQLELELKILENKVKNVIEKEKKFHYSAVKKPSLIKLKKRILELELEHEDHEKQIKIMEGTLGILKEGRSKKKVTKKISKKDVQMLESSLKKLEKRYNILNKSKNKSKELTNIKKRIIDFKSHIKKLKV